MSEQDSIERERARAFLTEHHDILEELSHRYFTMIEAGDLLGMTLLTKAVSAIIKETQKHIKQKIQVKNSSTTVN